MVTMVESLRSLVWRENFQLERCKMIGQFDFCTFQAPSCLSETNFWGAHLGNHEDCCEYNDLGNRDPWLVLFSSSYLM